MLPEILEAIDEDRTDGDSTYDIITGFYTLDEIDVVSVMFNGDACNKLLGTEEILTYETLSDLLGQQPQLVNQQSEPSPWPHYLARYQIDGYELEFYFDKMDGVYYLYEIAIPYSMGWPTRPWDWREE